MSAVTTELLSRLSDEHYRKVTEENQRLQAELTAAREMVISLNDNVKRRPLLDDISLPETSWRLSNQLRDNTELLSRLSYEHDRKITEENQRLQAELTLQLRDQQLLDENLALRQRIQDLEAANRDLRLNQISNQELLEKNRALQRLVDDLEGENRRLRLELPPLEPPTDLYVADEVLGSYERTVVGKWKWDNVTNEWVLLRPGDVIPTLRPRPYRSLSPPTRFRRYQRIAPYGFLY